MPRAFTSNLLSTMTIAAAVAGSLAAQPPAPAPAFQTTAVTVGRYRLQSNPWVSLHQRLMYSARFHQTLPGALTGDDAALWKKAVDSYRAFIGNRSPVFDAALTAVNDTLSGIRGSDLPASVPPPLASHSGK